MPSFPRSNAYDSTRCVFYTDEAGVTPAGRGVTIAYSARPVPSGPVLLRVWWGENLVAYGQDLIEERIPLLFVVNRIDQIVGPHGHGRQFFLHLPVHEGLGN